MSFAFGENWRRFLTRIDDSRVERARDSLAQLLGIKSLVDRSFLDVGSGSGLFSLAALRMGARHVRSFDADPASVECARVLRQRFHYTASQWQVDQASALDEHYLNAIGGFDVVYSWGVLHHTGALWRALELVHRPVNPGGLLVLAIYNDQGWVSRAWTQCKRAYNRASWLEQWLLLSLGGAYFWIPRIARDTFRGRPFAMFDPTARARGMSPWTDLIDWVGGYPFEVARRTQIVSFFAARGYRLERLVSCGRRSGCNEFVFRKIALAEHISLPTQHGIACQ